MSSGELGGGEVFLSAVSALADGVAYAPGLAISC